LRSGSQTPTGFVSRYATQEPWEFVAETFAVLATGGTVDADARELVTGDRPRMKDPPTHYAEKLGGPIEGNIERVFPQAEVRTASDAD